MRHYTRDLDEGIIFGPFESEQEAKQVAEDIHGIIFDESIFREKLNKLEIEDQVALCGSNWDASSIMANFAEKYHDGDYTLICVECGEISNSGWHYCPYCGSKHD
mgnify:CR=1 FL=1